jgi:1-aminocyclopropane-1-carboxylate deaminase/D-cysteine desulfhydrase-like pyridoxal-dependent ACC family enzyme
MSGLNFKIPERIRSLPKCRLCDLPTPIQELAGTFGTDNQIFIKRDDLNLPGFGGNKARKGEFIFGHLLDKGKSGIVWSSSPISNELRTLAYFGNKLDKDVVLITWGKKKDLINSFPNLFYAQRYGARVIYYRSNDRRDYIFERLSKRFLERNYYIQSLYDEALGAVAYIECGEEIDHYVNNNQLHFDYIFVCSSGATQIGLEVAKRVYGWKTAIIGINHIVWKDKSWLKQRFSNIWDMVMERILDINWTKPEFRNEIRYAVPGYGLTNSDVMEICTRMDLERGIFLDPYYSGKAFWGMLDMLKHQRGKRVLFIHTGGGVNLLNGVMELAKIPADIRLKSFLNSGMRRTLRFAARVKNVFK